jgi:membrane associated rhomboid family serine protease
VLPLRDNVPTRSFPYVTVGLIVANFIVWFWELSGRGLDYHVVKDGFYPCSVNGPCEPVSLNGQVVTHTLSWWESTFTSMFMHGSWEHILGNMLFLWIFGNNVEDALGHVRFLLWYLAAGVAAMAVQTFVTLHWATQQEASIPFIGASGAIAGVLGAYIVLLPGARVLTLVPFFIPIQLPALLFLGFWFVFQLYEGDYAITHPQASGGVAFFAHVGGFVFGLLTVELVRRRDWRPAAYAR